MFNSGMTVKSLIDDIKEEADISPDIQDSEYLYWVNCLEQVLYSDIIKEQRCGHVPVSQTSNYKDNVPMEDFNSETEAEVVFEDIIAVFADSKQLIKTTLLSGAVFNDCYFSDSGKLYCKIDGECSDIAVYYNVRPEIKVNVDGIVMLPYEHMDLMKAYIRMQAYKKAMEEELCATWTNEYNVLLEAFKVWINTRSANFGI